VEIDVVKVQGKNTRNGNAKNLTIRQSPQNLQIKSPVGRPESAFFQNAAQFCRKKHPCLF